MYCKVFNMLNVCVLQYKQKLPANNPFDLITAKVQRFYFNAANGNYNPLIN